MYELVSKHSPSVQFTYDVTFSVIASSDSPLVMDLLWSLKSGQVKCTALQKLWLEGIQGLKQEFAWG